MELFLFGIILIVASFFINDKQEIQKKYNRIRKTKDPFNDTITIDDKVDVQPFIKLRDAINSINPAKITPANLFVVLNEVEQKSGRRMFRRETMDVDALLKMKEKLNIANLDTRKTITIQELFGTTEDEVADYVKKYKK